MADSVTPKRPLRQLSLNQNSGERDLNKDSSDRFEMNKEEVPKTPPIKLPLQPAFSRSAADSKGTLGSSAGIRQREPENADNLDNNPVIPSNSAAAKFKLTAAQLDPRTEIPLAPKREINDGSAENGLVDMCYPSGWTLENNIAAIRALGEQKNPFFLRYTKKQAEELISNNKQRKTTLCEVLALHDLGYKFEYSEERQGYLGKTEGLVSGKNSIEGFESGLPGLPDRPQKGDPDFAKKMQERQKLNNENVLKYESFWAPKEPLLRGILGVSKDH